MVAPCGRERDSLKLREGLGGESPPLLNMTCARCGEKRKVWPDGMCAICGIIVSGKMPGVLGLNATMSDPWNPKGSVDQHNAIDGMYKRGEIDDTTAHRWDGLFCGQAKAQEYQEAKPMPKWLRRANEETDHSEKMQYAEREADVKASEISLRKIDAAIASEGIE